MADTLSFELVSPDRLLMSAEVEAVMVPGTEGDMTVMPGHMPLISTLRPAVVDVYATWGGAPSTRIFVRGGFVDVTGDRITLLAEHATNIAELDRAALALASFTNGSRDRDDLSYGAYGWAAATP